MFSSIWKAAGKVAEKTPDDRNRYVDFLRALSILFVIFGHWLIAAAVFNVQTDSMDMVDILTLQPSTQWLTWLFQVMPIFFIVGGYSNAISIKSSQAKQQNYAQWLSGRLHRLLTPLLILILTWAVIAILMRFGGAKTTTIEFATKAAIIPCWFLAIYTLIVILAPLTYRMWEKWGWWSWWVFAVMACLVDVLFFKYDLRNAGWSNYFWVWLAVHHLGFAWFDNKLAKPWIMFFVGVFSLFVLFLLVQNGPYPLAMAASPDKAVSNSLPPKITLILLALCQFGLLYTFEKPMQKVLRNRRIWTFTVLISSMIMSLYLWHMTVLLLTIEASYLLGGIGMHVIPGSSEWWWSRPVWLLLLVVFLLPVAMLMSRFERLAKPQHVPSAMRLVVGAVLAGSGIAWVVMQGFQGLIFDIKTWAPVVLLLIGTALSGLSILPKREKASS